MNFDRKKIKEVLTPLIEETLNSQKNSADLRRNTIDVFSQSIECVALNITKDEWEEREKTRQAQKTLQNKVGELHQKILGTLDGIKDLGVGGVVDLKGPGFIAEIKNKHNTTKGNHKVVIYDDLEKVLAHEPEGTVGYYVEILPKNGKSYDKPFTPPDNTTKQRRAENDRIRQIDGKTFYAKVTGDENALEKLYKILPDVTAEIIKEKFNQIRDPNKGIAQDEFDFIYNPDKD